MGEQLSENHIDVDWRVISVFDPDGTGSDFAYTVGLWDHGTPELHMWARPTHGTDVGWDFKLSPTDLQSLLNQYAKAALNGELHAGSTREEELDGGLSTMKVTVGEPVAAGELDANLADADADVVALRWELERQEVGTDTGLNEEWSGDAAELTQAWIDAAVDAGADPSDIDALLVTDDDEALGPFGPTVAAIRACVLADPEATAYSLATLAPFVARTVGGALGVTAALARRHGRLGAYDAARRHAVADAGVLAESVAKYFDDEPDEKAHLVASVRSALGSTLAACYTAWMLRDHIDDDTFHAATGLTHVCADPVGADEIFWSHPSAQQTFEHADTLTDRDCERAAAAATAAGDTFDAALLDAYARAATAGLGNPAAGGWLPHDDLSDDVRSQAGAAIDGAGLAAVLGGRDELSEPWRNAGLTH